MLVSSGNSFITFKSGMYKSEWDWRVLRFRISFFGNFRLWDDTSFLSSRERGPFLKSWTFLDYFPGFVPCEGDLIVFEVNLVLRTQCVGCWDVIGRVPHLRTTFKSRSPSPEYWPPTFLFTFLHQRTCFINSLYRCKLHNFLIYR